MTTFLTSLPLVATLAICTFLVCLGLHNLRHEEAQS